jgi:hypothetical protein
MPRGLVSLSQVALAFMPDDSLFGRNPPKDNELIFLGDFALEGKRGLLKIPEDCLLRMRYNPFYSYLEQRTFEWLETDTATSDP